MNEVLWEKLKAFEFDDPEADFRFSERLARENGWSRSYTLRVLEEYRRFLFLCCEVGHPVTPSDAVDQAWHLHLCYTRSYWQDLCRDTLEKEIHHGPTKGGNREQEKFSDWYGKTRESYERLFGESPPADIWPDGKERFRPARFQRVDRSRHWVLSRSVTTMLLVSMAGGLLAVGCTSEEIAITAVIGVVMVVVIVAVTLGARNGGGKGGSGCGAAGGCGDNGGGCGGGGCGGGGCGGGG